MIEDERKEYVASDISSITRHFHVGMEYVQRSTSNDITDISTRHTRTDYTRCNAAADEVSDQYTDSSTDDQLSHGNSHDRKIRNSHNVLAAHLGRRRCRRL